MSQPVIPTSFEKWAIFRCDTMEVLYFAENEDSAYKIAKAYSLEPEYKDIPISYAYVAEITDDSNSEDNKILN